MSGKLIEGAYSRQEFEFLNRWQVDEKVDGTNIRIIRSPSGIEFAGRTNNAQLPPHLLKYLHSHFTEECIIRAFPLDQTPHVVLYGEGYGVKIQACGGNYRADVGFILFDIKIGQWWLKREDVRALAEKLGVPMVPDLGIMTTEQVVEFVKSKPLSRCSRNPQMMEGVVCRSDPLMLFRDGTPLIWKLKCKEFS